MKTILLKVCSPILNLFEKGDEPYVYKSSHRTILLAVGTLFLLLSTGVVYVGLSGDGYGFLVPATVFGCAAIVSLVVGGLGSDKAVARLWGSK